MGTVTLGSGLAPSTDAKQKLATGPAILLRGHAHSSVPTCAQKGGKSTHRSQAASNPNVYPRAEVYSNDAIGHGNQTKLPILLPACARPRVCSWAPDSVVRVVNTYGVRRQ